MEEKHDQEADVTQLFTSKQTWIGNVKYPSGCHPQDRAKQHFLSDK